MLLPCQTQHCSTWTEQLITLIRQLKHAVLKPLSTVQPLPAFHDFRLMHFTVDMTWHKPCFFSWPLILVPLLWSSSEVAWPAHVVGKEVTDQHVIPSGLASVPVAASIRVAVGSRGYLCALHRLPDNAVSNLAVYDLLCPRLHGFRKLWLIGPVCLYTNPKRKLQWLLAFHCRAHPNSVAGIWYLWQIPRWTRAGSGLLAFQECPFLSSLRLCAL